MQVLCTDIPSPRGVTGTVLPASSFPIPGSLVGLNQTELPLLREYMPTPLYAAAMRYTLPPRLKLASELLFVPQNPAHQWSPPGSLPWSLSALTAPAPPQSWQALLRFLSLLLGCEILEISSGSLASTCPQLALTRCS